MSNPYQTNARRGQPDRLPGEIAVPEQVIVSMAEIAESAKEGLLALAVGTGLQVMAAMFGEDAEPNDPTKVTVCCRSCRCRRGTGL